MSRFVKEHTRFAFSASPDDDFGLNLFNHALKPQSETSLNCPDYKSIPIIDGWRHFDRFEKKNENLRCGQTCGKSTITHPAFLAFSRCLIEATLLSV